MCKAIFWLRGILLGGNDSPHGSRKLSIRAFACGENPERLSAQNLTSLEPTNTPQPPPPKRAPGRGKQTGARFHRWIFFFERFTDQSLHHVPFSDAHQ